MFLVFYSFKVFVCILDDYSSLNLDDKGFKPVLDSADIDVLLNYLLSLHSEFVPFNRLLFVQHLIALLLLVELFISVNELAFFENIMRGHFCGVRI